MAADYTITATETTLPGEMPTAEVVDALTPLNLSFLDIVETSSYSGSSGGVAPPGGGPVFPALAPSSRTFTQGVQPISIFQTYSGLENRVLLGANQFGLTLELAFQNLTEAEYNLIFAHYIATQGSYQDFDLSAEVLAGMSSTAYLQPTNYTYRYASPPSVQWVAPGIGTASVQLTASVPFT